VYLVGMKSYGRAPDLPVAHRVRAGPVGRGGDRRDRAAAGRVELVLPETGVCSGGGLATEPVAATAGCCG
jgi:hypothetical protein